MTDQVAARSILKALSKDETLENKVCADCANSNPQWASLSFAVFICLECAGQHRGYGVHISFVRSISMDTWQDEQIRRMQLAGNAPFHAFMRAYTPAEQGGYKEGMSAYDKYHCWAASQYREKLDAELAGKPWSPSLPPAGTASPGNGFSGTPPGRPSSAQGLRKSRASTRSNTGSNLRSGSASPASFNRSSPDPNSQKSLNESYFATLGQANADRPDHLPPSQGGKYTGFGSTPAPSSSSQHPSYGMSSAAAPSFNDIQENPMAALSKGWSLFSAAVVGASKVVSENVIQPGVERVTDPALTASVSGYLSEAQKRAAVVGSSANQWSKQQFGVDVAESVGGALGTVKDKIGGGPSRDGYGAVGSGPESGGLYGDGGVDGEDDDHFFGEYSGRYDEPQNRLGGGVGGSNSLVGATSTRTAAPAVKSNGWDDEWKDF